MKQELEDDQKSDNLYICTRLNERGKQLIQNCSKKQLMRATRQCLELIDISWLLNTNVPG
jgi:hypothetical protein